MKTTKKLLLIIAAVSLLVTCSKSDQFLDDEPLGNTKKNGILDENNQTFKVTLPFKADYIGNYTNIYIDPEKCGEYPWIRIINDGGGTATQLGKFTHHFDFCCNSENGIYPGDYMEAYFIAANGDKLFVECAGQVIDGRADDHPDYVISYFRDPFNIIGGTGRFEGATGGGMTDDYNSSNDPYSHHRWVGTITLVKGNH